jgi:SAM-dependent methyltransferase
MVERQPVRGGSLHQCSSITARTETVDDDNDAFGRALMDWTRGGSDPEIYERDDGFLDIGAGHELFLARYDQWPTSERQAMRHARGRIIDVGCGGGRVALHLQEKGHDVVGLDVSPLAAKAARLQGVNETWCMSIDNLTRKIGMFDTVVLFGNNFGIFGTPRRARTVLSAWAKRMPPDGRILAESVNPYGSGAPGMDRDYCRQNKDRGRLPGQARLRVRYRNVATPWFSWLFVSRGDMRALLRGTGWHQARVLGPSPSDPYVAVLEKD